MDSAIGTFEDAEHEAKLREHTDEENGHKADGVAPLRAQTRNNNREIDCGDGEDDIPQSVTAAGALPAEVHTP